MAAIPGDDGEFQSVANLVYSPDGADVWFDLGTSYGGGTIARVSDGGGLPELFLDIANGCAVNSAPSFSPDGSQMFTMRDVCTDYMQQGLVSYDAPPSGSGQVVLVDSDQVGLPLVAPQWIADGSGVVLDTNLHLDQDGDGTYETDGAAILVLNFADGQLYTLVPAIAGTQIRSFAISPDESAMVLCLDSGAGEDLVLVDLSGEAPTYLNLTSDGNSCYAVW
jgi:Tol biopolymer transport system component